MFQYATEQDVVAQFPVLIGMMQGRMPDVAAGVYCACVFETYAISQVVPSRTAHFAQPSVVLPLLANREAFAKHLQAAALDPKKVDWGKWLPVVLQILQGVLSGVLSQAA